MNAQGELRSVQLNQIENVKSEHRCPAVPDWVRLADLTWLGTHQRADFVVVGESKGYGFHDFTYFPFFKLFTFLIWNT